jgi:cobalt/nickel transport system permease protein
MNVRDSFLPYDGRTRLLVLLSLLIAVNILPRVNTVHIIGFALILVFLWLLSGAPVCAVIKRLCLVIPFIGLIILAIPFRPGTPVASFRTGIISVTMTREGLAIFYTVAVKTALSILGTVVLLSGIPFREITRGLKALGVPEFVVGVISFAYRYFYVVRDEALRTETAWASRYFGRRKLAQVAAAGRIVGRLFLRSYERSERLYRAMSARGFRGGFPDLQAGDKRRTGLVYLAFIVVSLSIVLAMGFVWGP